MFIKDSGRADLQFQERRANHSLSSGLWQDLLAAHRRLVGKRGRGKGCRNPG